MAPETRTYTGTGSDPGQRLTGRVALVTGASRGIGRAIADRLAAEGAKVIALSRNPDPAETWGLPEESLLPVAADIRDSSSVGEAVTAGVERFGRLDAIVNNAAIGLLRTAADTTDEQYDDLFDTNLRSIFHTARHCITHLRAAGSGSIVNIGSVAAHVGFSHDAAYCASKGAVLALTKQMAIDYAPRQHPNQLHRAGFHRHRPAHRLHSRPSRSQHRPGPDNRPAPPGPPGPPRRSSRRSRLPDLRRRLLHHRHRPPRRRRPNGPPLNLAQGLAV